MVLIGLIPILLPFDVSNQSQFGGLEKVTPILWQIIFTFVAVMVVLVLPFSIIYYESQNSAAATGCTGILRQTLCGLLFTFIIAIIFGLVVGISYIWLGIAEINVVYTIQSEFNSTLALTDSFENCIACARGQSAMYPQMSIFIYITAWVSIVGWVVFVFAGGLGLSALPINCVMFAITTRVRKIGMEDYKKCQKILVQYSGDIINQGSKINEVLQNNAWIPSAKKTREYRLYKEDAKQLEDDFQRVENGFKVGGTSIFKIIFTVLAGIICALISIIWLIHIFLWMIWIPPIFPFLNSLLDALEFYVFPVLAWAVYLFFVYYLLLCVLYGVIRIFANIPFINFYPMKYRDTLLNGFLVNCGVMLLASVTVCQFCAMAFSGYARYTAIDAMFATYINNMIYIKYFFQYVHYVFFAFIFIGFFAAIFELIYQKWIYPLLCYRKDSETKSHHDAIMQILNNPNT